MIWLDEVTTFFKIAQFVIILGIVVAAWLIFTGNK